ncbi:MAG: NAD(P)-binding domain-containing protein, partial [Chloroflexota bacterium]|nr:NAD(P)-binding domain-containing protein [Chloroflexota bacterium]
MTDGRTIAARRVVLAVGMGYFAHVPEDLAAMFPTGRGTHTCDAVDFASLAGRRCLILGGRQSAFEWAALIREAGAREVHMVHRHASPAFEEADWSWVNPLVEGMAANPGWFRLLSPAQQQEYGRRLWGEGRLKVEPWLEERVN